MSAQALSPDWLADRIPGTRAQDVRDAVSDLIADGSLTPGTRLPTIRALAESLDTKVSAVTGAWTMLREDGLVETRRRGGTVVAGSRPRSAAGSPGFPGWSTVELVEAWPDTALLPDTASVFAAAVDHARPLGSFVRATPGLPAALRAVWPFAAESVTTLPGGRIAVTTALEAALACSPGAVAVETPGMQRMAAVLDGLSAPTAPLESDLEGPVPASLRAAIEAGTTVVVYQPVARFPTGSTLTAERRDELAAVLRRHPQVFVVEEDPTGPLFRGASLGEVLPDRTVRVTQFSRAYGPDVDLVAVGGSARIVEAIVALQSSRGLRVNPLVQEVATRLLSDPAVRLTVQVAARRYVERHDALVAALAQHGVRTESAGGLFAWIPVPDAARALTTLAAVGVRVLAGGVVGYAGHLRVAVTRLPDDPTLLDELAGAIASAANGAAHLDAE